MESAEEMGAPPDRSTIALQTIAMPADTNPSGDIFGGWLLSQMDLAGGIVAARRAGGRAATVGVEAIKFHRPVMVGDVVTCYGNVVRVGRTSIAVRIQIWVQRPDVAEPLRVTEGVFTFVALDAQRRPRVVGPGP